MIEEIAEKPDYDYQQPYIEVIREFFYKISINKGLHVQISLLSEDRQN